MSNFLLEFFNFSTPEVSDPSTPQQKYHSHNANLPSKIKTF